MSVTSTKTEAQILALPGAQTYNLTQAPPYNYTNPLTLNLTGNDLTFTVPTSHLQAEGGSGYGGNVDPATLLLSNPQHGPLTITMTSPVSGFGLLLDSLIQFSPMHFSLAVYVGGALDATYSLAYTGYAGLVNGYDAPYFGVAVGSGTAGITSIVVSTDTDDHATQNAFCVGRFSIGGTVSSVVISPREVDVRAYNADGTRRAMPPFDELSFEIGENGGMQTGSVQILVPWEQTNWLGTEHIDVYLWGQLLYRGYVRQPQQEVGNPERSSPTLHGLMELLNGYMVRRDFGYAPAVSPSVLFADLAALYVTRTGRMPSLVLDTTGVDALGLTLWGLPAKGKTIPQALNALCDLFPQQLIWGCDVDSSGHNRLYLRPRATSVGYVFPVGDKISAFVYPRDCTKIVNRLFLTGAKFDGSNGTNPNNANLLPNASFEEGAQNNEIDGNRLQNGDFEEIDTFGTTDAWNLSGASVASGQGRSGNGIALNSAGNSLYQDIPLGGTPPAIHAAAWWNAVQSAAWSYQIKFEIYDTSNTLIASSYQTAQSVSGDPVGFTFLHVGYDWTPPAGLVNVSYLRVIYYLASTAGNTVIDDVSCWFDGDEQAKAWWASKSHLGGFTSLDWRNRDFTPYHGDVMLKAGVVVQSSGYAEISTRHKDRPQGDALRAYYLGFWVYTPTGSGTLHCAPGARIVESDTLKTTITGATQATTPGTWTHISTFFDPGANCDAIEPFLHFLDSGTYYVDAAGMWLDVTVSPNYIEADTYTAMRDTSMYTSGQIGTEAAASLATFGEREAEVSNDDITNDTDADAYAISYFKAMAVPSVQAKLSIKGAESPVLLDGQVKIVNLPQQPPALTPVRVHYTIGQSIDIDVDLNDERPQLENLLRLVAAGKA